MSFIQLHLLRTLPFSNPNRDDAGRPKSGILGGTERLRLSSQSVKRAIRESDEFASAIDGFCEASRTRMVPNIVAGAMLEAGIEEDKVELAVLDIVGTLMTVASVENTKHGAISREDWFKSAKSEELVFMSRDEINRLTAFCISTAETAKPVKRVAEKKKKGAEGDEVEEKPVKGMPATTYKVAAKEIVAAVFDGAEIGVDVALFGRMLAKVKATANHNVDGSVQVNHAVTTHQALAEDDYFTAMDDLNENGAGLIQSQGFGSGTYYSYACIDVRTLIENLGGDEAAARTAQAAIRGFLAGAINSVPGGKQTSYAHATRPFYARLEIGKQANRTLGDAFTAAVEADDIQQASIARLEDLANRQERAYGPACDTLKVMNLYDNASATIEELVAAAVAAVE